MCVPGCHSGVCVQDNECRCDDDHYGRLCEKGSTILYSVYTDDQFEISFIY